MSLRIIAKANARMADPETTIHKQEIDVQAQELQRILERHNDKRVIVLGGTCTGKTTLLKYIEDAHDMDKLIFPLLSQEETDFVCQTPWTPEIGEVMTRLTKERIDVEPGKPVFGTVVLDADLIVQLKISDEALTERTAQRGVSFEDAKNMQTQIEDEINKSGLPVVEFIVG